jgi:steroid delta-isomerase-like uncharacterized protein
MSETAVKLVESYLEGVWNGRNPDALDTLTSPDFTYHLSGQPARDAAEMREFLRAMRVAFPDWRIAVRDIVADDGRVAVRWSGSATHEGSFRGIEPTGRRIEVSGINFYAIEDGRISAEWEQMDSLGMLQQLGRL